MQIIRLLFIFVLLVSAGQVSFGQTQEQIDKTATSVLHAFYSTQNPHYARAAEQLPDLQEALKDLKQAVVSVHERQPGRSHAKFESCLKLLNTAARRTSDAIHENDFVERYGHMRALLTPFPDEDQSDNWLAKVLNCVMQLNDEVGNDPDIRRSLSRVSTSRDIIENNFQQIDEAKSETRARADMKRLKLQKTPVGDNGVVGTPGNCEKIDFQNAGYVVKDSRVEDPFDFLPWVSAREKRARAKIAALVDGQPFHYETVLSQAVKIIEDENFLPSARDARVQVRLELVSVENCLGSSAGASPTLELVYRLYSTQIMPVLSSAPETRLTEKQAPQTAAGQTTVKVPDSKRIYFTPRAGYDSADKLSAGGRFEFTPDHFWKLPFKSVAIEGLGSTSMKVVSAALSGSVDPPHSWLAHAEWLFNYANFSLPTGSGQLKGGHLSAQFSGMTKPLLRGNFTFRFGSLLEGGNRQSSVRNVPLPPDTVANSGFGSWKFYAGLDSRLRHTTFSISYGLELGSLHPRAGVDWRKHIADVRHEFWYPLGNHHILDLESRLTLGHIQVPGKIPLSERFFGGNNEEFFMPGDTWQIRANPVIRAIPGSSFYQTAAGAGGDRFFSYNLTAAYAVWRKSLVPQELTDDADFKSELSDSIETLTNSLQNYYSTKDQNYLKVIQQLPTLLLALTDSTSSNSLKEIVQKQQQGHEDIAGPCLKAVNTAIRRTGDAIAASDAVEKYGNTRALLSPSQDEDENRLGKVMDCGQKLNNALGNNPDLSRALATVGHIRDTMESEFSQIKVAQAEQKARADMAFTKRTLNTLFNEVNIYSISPVVVFDVASIGPQRNGLGGIRYGPGVGLRLELATIAHFTAGYAWNVKQGPGEGRGTVFFSIGVRDLFH